MSGFTVSVGGGGGQQEAEEGKEGGGGGDGDGDGGQEVPVEKVYIHQGSASHEKPRLPSYCDKFATV